MASTAAGKSYRNSMQTKKVHIGLACSPTCRWASMYEGHATDLADRAVNIMERTTHLAVHLLVCASSMWWHLTTARGRPKSCSVMATPVKNKTARNYRASADRRRSKSSAQATSTRPEQSSKSTSKETLSRELGTSKGAKTMSLRSCCERCCERVTFTEGV